MNIDRYLTDDVVHVLRYRLYDRSMTERVALRGVLPGIFAQHRADVLREAATGLGHDSTCPASGTHGNRCRCVHGDLLAMADEAVAE